MDSVKRIFITCGSGFVLQHIIKPLLNREHNSILTLLFLAESQSEADEYFNGLIQHLDLNPTEKSRLRLLRGDLRMPNLGLSHIEEINSNYWINGTLPYRFGSINPESVAIAKKTTYNYLKLLVDYEQRIEKVKHYNQISSIRVNGQSTTNLPESLTYEYIPIGNFDYCKHECEMILKDWIESGKLEAKTTVTRIDCLLSPNMSQIGGSILLLAKELLGFGRIPTKAKFFFADEDGVLRFSPIELATDAIVKIALNPPNEKIRVVNLANNYDRPTAIDLVEIINQISDDNVVLRITPPDTFTKQFPREDREFYIWMQEIFGWVTQAKATNSRPDINNAEYLLGQPWLNAGNSSNGWAKDFLRNVLNEALKCKFSPLNKRKLGNTIIY